MCIHIYIYIYIYIQTHPTATAQDEVGEFALAPDEFMVSLLYTVIYYIVLHDIMYY